MAVQSVMPVSGAAVVRMLMAVLEARAAWLVLEARAAWLVLEARAAWLVLEARAGWLVLEARAAWLVLEARAAWLVLEARAAWLVLEARAAWLVLEARAAWLVLEARAAWLVLEARAAWLVLEARAAWLVLEARAEPRWLHGHTDPWDHGDVPDVGSSNAGYTKTPPTATLCRSAGRRRVHRKWARRGFRRARLQYQPRRVAHDRRSSSPTWIPHDPTHCDQHRDLLHSLEQRGART